MPRNPNCTRCPLSTGVNHVCLWGHGAKHAEIMLVGEAPGAEEDREGLPFIGAAGQILDRCLSRAGMARKDVYIANAVKCRPPGNRDPSKEELGACFPYLAEEIASVQPKVIIAIGRWSLKVLTGQDAIAKSRGRLLDPLPKIRIGEARIITTYHPAAYLHSHKQSILDAIVEDLKSAKNLANPTVDEPERILLPEGYSSRKLVDALRRIAPARDLACDLEWLALPNKESISWPWTKGCSQLSMSLTGRVTGRLVTVALAWPPRRRGLRAIKAFLKNRGLIFHNAMADVIWMLAAGLEPSVTGDSMLLSYLLDEQRRAGLKGLAPLVAGVEAGWEQKPWYRRPESRKGWLDLLRYNAGDTESTLRLHEGLLAQLHKLPADRGRNINRIYRTLLLPAVKPFARAALNGVPIGKDAIRRERKHHHELMTQAIARLSAATGLRPDVAERLANSPAQVKRYAREAYNLDVDSSREDALADYVDTYPALADIQEIKHERKMDSTYMGPWERLTEAQGDGRLHSIYLLGATRTGRLSAELEEGGSLLLTPRDDWMRDLVEAPPGWEIFSADYSQLELRIIAWLAPERTMRQLYQEGADLHKTTAAYAKAGLPLRAFWKRREELVEIVTKDERQAGKSNNFGFAYGMGEDKYVAYAKKSYGVRFTAEQAHSSRDGYFELYSDLLPWHARSVEEWDRRGYTLTPFGRYRFDIKDGTQAINTPIQATGSDLTLFAASVIDERIQTELDPRKVQYIGFVHDAILVLAKTEHDPALRERVKAIITESMEHPPLERVGIDEIPVPLVAEVKHGKTWAKAQ